MELRDRDRDPRKSIVVVVESRDIASLEGGLPLPTYRELATQADDADKPVMQTPVKGRHQCSHPSLCLQRRHLTIRTLAGYARTPAGSHPARYMDVPDGRSAGTVDDNDDDDDGADGDSSPERPIHDVSYLRELSVARICALLSSITCHCSMYIGASIVAIISARCSAPDPFPVFRQEHSPPSPTAFASPREGSFSPSRVLRRTARRYSTLSVARSSKRAMAAS